MSMPLKYLNSLEYSLGNGQCPECFGVPPSWHGHPCHPTPASIGHVEGCQLAAAIIAAGGKIIYKGALHELPLGPRYKKGSIIYKYHHSKEYKAWKKKCAEEMDSLLISILAGEKIKTTKQL